MGIFGNPNRDVEKIIKKLKKQGFSSENYKQRKCCEKCFYFSSATSNCTYHNKRTMPSNFCHQYWAK